MGQFAGVVLDAGEDNTADGVRGQRQSVSFTLRPNTSGGIVIVSTAKQDIDQGQGYVLDDENRNVRVEGQKATEAWYMKNISTTKCQVNKKETP